MAEKDKVYLAVDIGASGGRVLAGLFDGRRLRLEENFRFANGPVAVGPRAHWDLLGLWQNVQQGLRTAALKFPGQVASVGVDTWGVDYGLLGKDDELLGNPFSYRDRRTAGIFDRAFSIVSREEIFAETGLQFMEFNTIYQLLAAKQAGSAILDIAQSLLMMPDLFHWLLTGEKANEFTDVSTTQLYNPHAGDWSRKLIARLGLPERIFGQIVPPGTKLGKLRPAVVEATGLADAAVIVPGTHDTASAVMAVPAASKPGARPDWCYISSGTWSLMGVEVASPVINDRVRQLNFTNEGGVGGTIRLLKNIAGLWLVQECRRVWAKAGHEFGWDALVHLADESKPLVSLLDPDHPSFTAPSDMPTAIREYCAATGQPIPDHEGPVIRAAFESLALRYRMVLAWLEELVGGPIDTIHIVGGGAQNRLLCQMAADACKRRVVTGPIEATAIGNILVQAVSSGDVGSIAEARELVRRSFDVQEYLPRNTAPWDEANERFLKLLAR